MCCFFSLIDCCKYKTYFEFYATITLQTSWDKDSKTLGMLWLVGKKTIVQIFHR